LGWYKPKRFVIVVLNFEHYAVEWLVSLSISVLREYVCADIFRQIVARIFCLLLNVACVLLLPFIVCMLNLLCL